MKTSRPFNSSGLSKRIAPCVRVDNLETSLTRSRRGINHLYDDLNGKKSFYLSSTNLFRIGCSNSDEVALSFVGFRVSTCRKRPGKKKEKNIVLSSEILKHFKVSGSFALPFDSPRSVSRSEFSIVWPHCRTLSSADLLLVETPLFVVSRFLDFRRHRYQVSP